MARLDRVPDIDRQIDPVEPREFAEQVREAIPLSEVFAVARGILRDYFGEHPPGSTLCILRGLAHPDFLLEIEAIAAV